MANVALHLAARTFEAGEHSCAEDHISGLLFLGNPRDRVFMGFNRDYAGTQLPGSIVLVLCQSGIEGERRWSLMRASAVGKRQLMPTACVLHLACQAVTSRSRSASEPMRRSQH